MGKGDTRTRRGKIFNRSYGKSRPNKAKGSAAKVRRPAAGKVTKKTK